ncbi:MAG TPA: hypothetical protein VEX86_11620 [Longimicrobium sp.]|nr:hypothetical protein [Longimicrobium sp.]
MKKLVLDELDVESFVITPGMGARLGTVRGQAGFEGFTEPVSCFLSDCGSCRLTCGETAQYSCPDTCQVVCAGEA